MKEFVIDLLTKNLPKTYYYHCVDHTVYVVEKVNEIGKHEKCSDEDLRLLTAAALWHDTGFISTYDNHEEEGLRLAKKHLPEFGFSTAEINIICGMIEATRIPQTPKNKLEEIIADADLEYLGTPHAERIATNLYKELYAKDNTLTEAKWDEIQISFLEKHHYFTKYCRENRNPAKLDYLNKLKSRI